MPRHAYRPPEGEPIVEPYERYLYRDVRDELVRRQLGSRISGRGLSKTKSTILELLRESDSLEPGKESPAASTSRDSKQPAVNRGTETSVEPLATAAAKRGSSPAAGIPKATARGAAKSKSASATARAGAGPKSPRAGASPTATRGLPKATRAVRPRRGCRFRLVNVLLSPDFNTRWSEMITSREASTLEVNAFWLDVHVAFNQQNSLFDALHFQDALFVNVDASVALAHSAARLLTMWVEVVGMYRTAVRSAQQAADAGNTSQSFFDFCAGRLDLLYLHMALLLESELFEFVMGDSIPGSGSVPVAKLRVIDRSAAEVEAEAETAAKSASSSDSAGGNSTNKETAAVTGKTQTTTAARTMRQQRFSVAVQASQGAVPTIGAGLDTRDARRTEDKKGAKRAGSPKRPTHTPVARQETSQATASPTTEARSQPAELSGMPVQNPELAGPELLAAYTAPPAKKTTPKKPAKLAGHAKEKKTAAFKYPTTKLTTTTSPVAKTSASKTVSTPTEPPSAPVAAPTTGSMQPTPAPVVVSQTPSPVANAAPPTIENGRPRAQSLHRGMDESAIESNPDGAVSSDFDADPRDPRPRRRSSSKRPRESTEPSTDIVAVPDSSSSNHTGPSTELVPHPHKRFHATVSTALTPARSASELMLPPDEWDILENRLRKINENIDRCHRSLTGVEASVSEGYRKTLEADLRFFSAIKQRLQEQLLVVMQSGY